MRDKHYPNRTMRVADDVWEAIKLVRKESGLSWNLFIKLVTTKFKNHEQKSKETR